MSSLVSKVIVDGSECNEVRYNNNVVYSKYDFNNINNSDIKEVLLYFDCRDKKFLTKNDLPPYALEDVDSYDSEEAKHYKNIQPTYIRVKIKYFKSNISKDCNFTEVDKFSLVKGIGQNIGYIIRNNAVYIIKEAQAECLFYPWYEYEPPYDYVSEYESWTNLYYDRDGFNLESKYVKFSTYIPSNQNVDYSEYEYSYEEEIINLEEANYYREKYPEDFCLRVSKININ